jgi:hypothetical protein
MKNINLNNFIFFLIYSWMILLRQNIITQLYFLFISKPKYLLNLQKYINGLRYY